jgi:polysaccharide export outer membrane protein
MILRRFFISNVALAFISFLILSGCATTEPASKAIQPSSEEISKEIRLTEFILGPGDIVEITVYRYNDLTRTIPIDTSGKISYPLIGDIQAAGLSIFQLRDKIRDGLLEYFKDPQVSVSIKSVQSQKVYVLGEVVRPGVFALNTPMSAIEAISSAGGFTTDAKDGSVMVIRGNKDNPQLIKLDLRSALKEGDVAQNIQLQGSDIVFVPATFIADASRFAVYLRNLLWPVLLSEEIIVRGKDVTDVLRGKDTSGRTVIIERPPQ